MAITRKPATPVAWPPYDHAGTHSVQNGDNWWSLALRYQRTNEWDLIQYNFHTKDPAEINWYLYHFVGCRTETADGKNYRFSSSDSPGILYVPPLGWSDGVVPEDDADPRPSEAAKAAVLKVLNDPRLKGLECSVEVFGDVSFDLGGSALRKVKTLVQSGTIQVYYDPSRRFLASYDSGRNRITLPYEDASTPARRCWILWACLYASLDASGSGTFMANQTAEFALVGTALYAIKVCQTVDQLIIEVPHKSVLLKLAWQLAREIEGGGLAGYPSWEALQYAIAIDPTFAGKRVHLDGV